MQDNLKPHRSRIDKEEKSSDHKTVPGGKGAKDKSASDTKVNYGVTRASEKGSQKKFVCLNSEWRKKGTKHKLGVRNCPYTSADESSQLIADYADEK